MRDHDLTPDVGTRIAKLPRMIIWSGFGFLVAAFVFGFSLLGNLLSNLFAPGYYDAHRWPVGISLFFAAAACWFTGQYLRNRKAQVVIDKQTGQELVINRSYHALFFIPMYWWAPILVLIGLCLIGGELLSR